MIKKELLDYISDFDDKEQVILFLLSLKHDIELRYTLSPKSLFKLIEDGIIDKDYVVSKYTILVPIYEEEVSVNNIPERNYSSIKKSVEENIHSYRTLFKGIRIGSMGKLEDCISRMTEFIINHNTSLDEIITATMYYLEKEHPDYIMNADNFISNEKGSKLAIVMDEMPSKRLL